MVGTGDRSEKIRTYNFPQNRVTDHRIGLTIHQLTEVMDGKLQPHHRCADHALPGGKAQAGNRRGVTLGDLSWRGVVFLPHRGGIGPCS